MSGIFARIRKWWSGFRDRNPYLPPCLVAPVPESAAQVEDKPAEVAFSIYAGESFSWPEPPPQEQPKKKKPYDTFRRALDAAVVLSHAVPGFMPIHFVVARDGSFRTAKLDIESYGAAVSVSGIEHTSLTGRTAEAMLADWESQPGLGVEAGEGNTLTAKLLRRRYPGGVLRDIIPRPKPYE